jgi:pimeloyl-ACP methyl ester carboxylesterase
VHRADRADAHHPPLVLIHGLGTTSQIWSLVAPELSRQRPTVTLDLPGFGASAPAGRGFELDAVADRVGRGLAAHRIKGPFDLVGHSLGGAVALTLAAIRPRSIRRLVLVAPAGLRRRAPIPLAPLSPGVEGWFAVRRRLVPLTDLDWGRRALLAFAVADGARLSPGQARVMIQASDGASRIGPAFATVARADLRPLLHRVSAPLGLIWGEHDRTIPSRSRPSAASSSSACPPEARTRWPPRGCLATVCLVWPCAARCRRCALRTARPVWPRGSASDSAPWPHCPTSRSGSAT